MYWRQVKCRQGTYASVIIQATLPDPIAWRIDVSLIFSNNTQKGREKKKRRDKPNEVVFSVSNPRTIFIIEQKLVMDEWIDQIAHTSDKRHKFNTSIISIGSEEQVKLWCDIVHNFWHAIVFSFPMRNNVPLPRSLAGVLDDCVACSPLHTRSYTLERWLSFRSVPFPSPFAQVADCQQGCRKWENQMTLTT